MCEPTHSIVQYPPQGGPPTGTDSPQGGPPTGAVLEPGLREKVLKWGKKVLGWLHFSKMGGGHSEALKFRTGGTYSYLMPKGTGCLPKMYEAFWWERRVRLDDWGVPTEGEFSGQEFARALALEAATGYAEAVSIGSLTALRRFLEISMRKTDSPHLYVTAFLENLLTKEGRDVATRKLKSVLSSKKLDYNLYRMLGYQPQQGAVETAIKVMLGLTRKRSLLVPAWADDSSLWTPPGQ